MFGLGGLWVITSGDAGLLFPSGSVPQGAAGLAGSGVQAGSAGTTAAGFSIGCSVGIGVFVGRFCLSPLPAQEAGTPAAVTHWAEARWLSTAAQARATRKAVTTDRATSRLFTCVLFWLRIRGPAFSIRRSCARWSARERSRTPRSQAARSRSSDRADRLPRRTSCRASSGSVSARR